MPKNDDQLAPHESNEWVCEPCYFAHHYGFKAAGHDGGFLVGPDFEEKDYTELEPLLRLAGHDLFDNTDSNTGEGIHTSSSSACDGCGTLLAGYRFRLMAKETTDA